MKMRLHSSQIRVVIFALRKSRNVLPTCRRQATAVGQASRLSSCFLRRLGRLGLKHDRRDACPTTAGGMIAR